MRTQIFISYRRNGGLETAQYLYDQLQDAYEVFFDMKSLRSGRFDENIEKAILDSTDFLLILSENIFDRFEEEDDWISRELSLALDNGKNLIPIFLPDFSEPKLRNETIRTAMHYNGIPFNRDTKFNEALHSFLKSNRKCVLPVRCESRGYVLTEAAVDALKEAYRDMTASKEHRVHVVLQFPNAVESSKIIDPVLLCGYDRELGADALCQLLLRHQQKKQRTLEVAIEFMMSDANNLDTVSVQSALKYQKLAQEFHRDQDGRLYFYETVAVWVQVIEELLLEVTLPYANRLIYYANQRNEFIRINCIVDRMARNTKRNWSFRSHAEPEELTLEGQTWYPLLKPGVLSLKPETLLQCVLPDFYYKAALELCYSDDQQCTDALLDPGANIRFLTYYWYSLS